MGTSEHIVLERLERFVAGESSEAESEEIMTHFAHCEECMSLADELWVREPMGTTVSEIAGLDGQTADRLQRELVKRLHRSNLSGAVFTLGTQGFFSVAMALLHPLMSNRPRNRNRRSR
jgi:hypothetical protein